MASPVRRRSGRLGHALRGALVALVGLWCALSPTLAHAQTGDTSGDEVFPDFPIANGYYFSEAAGNDPAHGYTVTDAQGITFWDAFQRLGGVDGVGYPSTSRFIWNGFVDQAMQKLIFQWNPAQRRVDIVNVFDVLEQRGLDGWLLAKEQVPPSFDNSADAGKSWAQVVARHQAELNWNAAIKARYFADADPIAHFGLPQSYADEGNVLVVRCQRAVFQQWKVDVPWAKAGTVTIANGGDIAKAAGVLPAGAAQTASADGLIVTPLGFAFSLTPQQETAARAAAAAIRPSLVLIGVDLGDGELGFGSGVIVDPSGLVVTDAHVVEGAKRTAVQLADGRTLPAQIVGHDALPDVAVLRIPASGLPAVQPAAAPAADAVVASLGFAPAFPAPPTLRAGQVLTARTTDLGGASIGIVVDDLFNYFGDSGGPVFNLQGQVIGLVDAGTEITVRGVQIPISVETGFASILPIIHQIVATGKSTIRPVAGFAGAAMSEDIARQVGVPNVKGVLLVRVDAGSPADKAGLAAGDIVTAVDGTPTPDDIALKAAILRHQPGDQIAIAYVDPSGGLHTVRLTLAGE